VMVLLFLGLREHRLEGGMYPLSVLVMFLCLVVEVVRVLSFFGGGLWGPCRVLEEAAGRMGLSMVGLSLEGSLLRGSSIHTVLL
jgi:hypothetical protein